MKSTTINPAFKIAPEGFKWSAVVQLNEDQIVLVAKTKRELEVFWKLVAPAWAKINWKLVQKVTISKR